MTRPGAHFEYPPERPRRMLLLAAAAALILYAAIRILFPSLQTSLTNENYPLRIALPGLSDTSASAQAGIGSATNPTLDLFEGDALRDALDEPRPQLAVLRPDRVTPDNVMALDFDLAAGAANTERYDRSDGGLVTSKPLLVDGVSSGSARIRIEDNARISIAASSVADAIGNRGDALPDRLAGMIGSRSGYIPFNELRAAGIAVRYDATTDRISLSIPG